MIKNYISKTNFVKISPTKLQYIISKIRKKNYKEALIFLENFPQRAGRIIFKCLKAAAFNAVKNSTLARENLIVSEIFVTRSSILKRIQPRAKGKAYKIEKKFSHLTIFLK